jgi:transposase
MLRMDQVCVVRHKVLVEKLTQREVARQLGISRNTISKYLREPEPAYRQKNARAKPAVEKVRGRIDQLLEEWRGRTTRKQRITGTRIHRQLIEEGLVVGETTVYAYLRERRLAEAEVFIPLSYRPGEVGQVDFFEVTVEVEGQQQKAWKFLMRLMCPESDFAWLYSRQDQISFFDGHVRAFAHFGGVPARLVYDNLKLAVKKYLGSERKLTERFQALVSHYLFEPCFTRLGEGHDKGGVENRGKGIRLEHLVPIPRGKTLNEISEGLVVQLKRREATRRGRDGKTVEELMIEERKMLRELPATPFEARKVAPVFVSSKSTVQIEGAVYSVPTGWARRDATAYIGVEDIRLVCAGQEQTIAKQAWGVRTIKYRHYLPELARKPQAVRQVAPELIRELGEPFGGLWKMLVETHGEREAARVLARVIGAMVDHGESAVKEALEKTAATGQLDLLRLSELVHKLEEPARISVPDELLGYEIGSGQASDYDYLLKGGVQ